MEDVLITVGVTVAAAALALLFVAVTHVIIKKLAAHSRLASELAEHTHRPVQFAITLMAVQLAVRFTTADSAGAEWRRHLLHALVLLVMAAGAWLIGAFLVAFEDLTLSRWRTDVPDNRRARQLHTQVVMLRRVTIAVIVVVTAGVMLMTFPDVRAVGGGLLASAGLVSVVAALAAQTLLSNFFAGLQLAFSDAVRLDDVVVIEGEWGKIEELTLSYVVVQIWDDRRLILPTSYFTSKPFQNWTRTQSAVLGTAEFDVDWSVPVQDMRDELRNLLEGTQLWDGRVCVLQVTDATGGMIRLRALVSAQDAGTLWDLRCLVREHLVAWVRDRQPTTMPRWRAEVGDSRGDLSWQWGEKRRPAAGRPSEPHDDARLFGGSEDGNERNDAFVGPEEPVHTH
ncbi:mechanosensitive ion channel family protein [Catenuloplanes indicus]|uniref:Small-conductance mechanosensitive channel n=1 Tax=Catenuloplanes indicus TaxID=137267 RepID=A0AAE3W7B4_9ACTN|nr:mechanosensitive ion channel domain-containing protein [Catenuloplanes indicus]MDQ0369817.1 small-conductance mechanosensitive channel [Catenuloplanes indicus]